MTLYGRLREKRQKMLMTTSREQRIERMQEFIKALESWGRSPDVEKSIVEIQLEAQKNMNPWDRPMAKL